MQNAGRLCKRINDSFKTKKIRLRQLIISKKYVNSIDRYYAMLYSGGMNRFVDNWATQLRKGILEVCILNAIRGGKVYGYDIVRRIREIDGLIIGEGTIYPILSRLKREGFTKTSIMESTEGPPRKYYELTEKGKEVLAEMNKQWHQIKYGTDSVIGEH
jgi:PadR family transcriptional regulator, regulatory protein PadR